MATWLIHLILAEKCERSLPIRSIDDYIVGTLAPDSGKALGHGKYFPDSSVTHWAADGHKRNSDHRKFYEQMLKGRQLAADEESFLWGYFVHLLCDHMWSSFMRDVYTREGYTEEQMHADYPLKPENSMYERIKLLQGECGEYINRLRNIKRYECDIFDYLDSDMITDRLRGAAEYFDYIRDNDIGEMKHMTVEEIDSEILAMRDAVCEFVRTDIRHYMNLAPQPFEKIKTGAKTIELRLYDEKRQKIKVDDEIEFTQTQTGEKLAAKVCGMHIFKDFAALYSSLDLLKCGYDETTVKSAKPQDMNEYYSDEAIKKYGAVGIEIKLI